MTQTKDKKPDDETGDRGGGGFWELGISSTARRLQLIAAYYDADGQPRKHWLANIEPGGAVEKALLQTIREVGIDLSGMMEIATQAGSDAQEKYERKSLELGDMVPCEVCGAATKGGAVQGSTPEWGHAPQVSEKVLSELLQHVPDTAGRIFGVEQQKGRIAVCIEKDECWEAFWSHWKDLHLRAAKELDVKPYKGPE